MKYRYLLIVMSLVAMGAWVWAAPSKEVRIPSAPPAQTSFSPDRPLTPKSLLTAQSLDESVMSPEQFESDWKGLDSSQFLLTSSIVPGATLKETRFEIDYSGPDGYELTSLQLRDTDGHVMLFGWDLKPVSPGHWSLTGADLDPGVYSEMSQFSEGFEPAALPKTLKPGYWQLTASILDPRPDHFSRGANTLTLESTPVEIATR